MVAVRFRSLTDVASPRPYRAPTDSTDTVAVVSFLGVVYSLLPIVVTLVVACFFIAKIRTARRDESKVAPFIWLAVMVVMFLAVAGGFGALGTLLSRS